LRGESVVALVLLEWSVGLVAASCWTQSWAVVRRGHFRVAAWTCGLLALPALLSSESSGLTRVAIAAFAALTAVHLVAQYILGEPAGIVAGGTAAVIGVASLASVAGVVPSWPWWQAFGGLVAGAALLGAVTNGMLLGHWYLNQPGLQTWVLARLTTLTLVTVAASTVAGLVAAGLLAGASSEGAGLSVPGAPGLLSRGSLSPVFFITWLGLLAFTGAVAWMAQRCIQIRSIQSATGLYYVAILTAGVSEFLVRYLMLNA
jgi:hypothetical protein